MKKSHTLLAFLALALAAATVLPGAWAYFTANARAGGGRTVQFQNETGITEQFADWNKDITITAASGTQPVHVRARAYSAYGLDYSGEGWQLNDADGWYYYSTPLANPVDAEKNPVEAPAWTARETAPLRVHVQLKDLKDGEEPEDFDVVVVYETTPVVYNADGSPVPAMQADWSPELIMQNGGAAE